jgi:hypothetical protein
MKTQNPTSDRNFLIQVDTNPKNMQIPLGTNHET